MFTPFEYYCKEKTKTASESIKNLQKEWSTLDDSQMLQFIKQSEASFNSFLLQASKSDSDATQVSITKILNQKELKILFQSYGMPEKPGTNSMQFYHNTKMSENNVEWSTLDKDAKAKIQSEFQESSRIFHEKFFKFARNLSSNLVDEYLEFARIATNKSKTTNGKPESKLVSNQEKLIKEMRSKVAPYEVYFEKNQQEYFEYSLFIGKSKARTKYNKLSDKKKLKYIKKAEEIYDSFEIDESITSKPIFSNFISKQELLLLLRSYGMPDKIGANLSSYYFRLHAKDYDSNHMKLVFEKFKSLSKEEKDLLEKERLNKLEEFQASHEKFMVNLPKKRIADLAAYENHVKGKWKKKNEKDASTETETVEETDHIETNLKQDELDDKTIDSFIESNPIISKNVFSTFVNNELNLIAKDKAMNNHETKTFLNKIGQQWIKLDEQEKTLYEELFKQQKKDFKKSIKKFIKESPNTNIDLDTFKTKIMEKLTAQAKTIEFILLDDNQETLYLMDEKAKSLLDSQVTEIKLKNKKLLNGNASNDISTLSPNKKQKKN